MKSLISAMVAVVIAAVLCITISACGKKVSIDTEQFRAPIVEYMKMKSYRMEIVEFTGAQVADADATVTCKLKDSEGLYGLAVTWDFEMTKNGDSWKVVKHVTR